MPENHTDVTVNTLIPRQAVSDLEMLMLVDHGFDYKLEDDGLLFFYATDYLCEEVSDYSLEPIDVKKGSLRSENSIYFDSEGKLASQNYQTIFQNIIRRSQNLDAIEIAGAFTHDDLEIGEVGGFALLITKDKVLSKGTDDIFAQLRAEAEGGSALLKELDDPDGNDYIFSPAAESAWISVNNVSLYVRPTDESVTVGIYPLGKEAENPLDVAHVNFADVVMGDLDEESEALRP
ncbi:hypothetical protein Q9L42_020820 (plasmid) [Methylomarinum sp. Ch1-1]|uniref:Uncharacterized protein n=1 Tax=Methylomarinum roseum TaxID=3067653 RepID=A0AAU7P0M0_9GAMM|nr:hypothetical protein [Methylomarinum sp. Ch1-1]MDP4518964.1 hypothetical protein [Methylomarinum sp. Ch1-1]MDP4523362.1 hypothetical protein [Methylomarinum sp. Ch1-1]